MLPFCSQTLHLPLTHSDLFSTVPTVLSFPECHINPIMWWTVFFFLTDAYLIYKVVLVSGVQQSDSSIHTHTHTHTPLQKIRR